MVNSMLMYGRVYKCILIGVFSVLLIEIGMSISFLAGLPLTEVKTRNESFTHSLMGCVECPDKY